MRSRLSKLSVLLGVGAAISIAAAPAAVLRHSHEHVPPRGDVQSLHASAGVAAPVSDRATDGRPAHRRAPIASGVDLFDAAPAPRTRSTALGGVRLSADHAAAGQLALRGYDATAPPLT